VCPPASATAPATAAQLRLILPAGIGRREVRGINRSDSLSMTWFKMTAPTMMPIKNTSLAAIVPSTPADSAASAAPVTMVATMLKRMRTRRKAPHSRSHPTMLTSEAEFCRASSRLLSPIATTVFASRSPGLLMLLTTYCGCVTCMKCD